MVERERDALLWELITKRPLGSMDVAPHLLSWLQLAIGCSVVLPDID